MSEKPKTPKSPPAEPEKVKEVKKIREGIEENIKFSDFIVSDVGQAILRHLEIDDMFEIFDDFELFDATIRFMESDYPGEIPREYLETFLEMSAKQEPACAQECFTMPLFEAVDLKDRERIWELVKTEWAKIDEEDGVEEEDRPMPTPMVGPETEPIDLGEYEMRIYEPTMANIAENFTMLKEFEKSKLCQELLAAHGLTSIFEIFTDKSIYDTVTTSVFELRDELNEFDELADDSVEKQGMHFIIMQSSPAPKLPQETVSPERQLLTEPGQLDNLPPEVVSIIGSHASFWEAMEEDAEEEDAKTAFDIFIERLEQLKKTIKPELLSEMLVIAAETSSEMAKFLKDYNANSWHHAMQNREIFLLFATKGWLENFKNFIEPSQLFYELLKVAASTSKENAQWFLDKAEQDEAGETKLEGEWEEDSIYYYILRELIGEEAFERVMETARETLGKSE